MTSALRVLAVVALVVGAALAGGRLLRTGSPGLTVETVTDGATGAPASEASYVQHTSCGEARVTVRSYGEVVTGNDVEARLSAGELLVLDLTETADRLRVRVGQPQGRSRLVLVDGDTRTSSVTFERWNRRTAVGWPPHWAVGAVVTGPGCWILSITGSGVTERLPLELTKQEWEREWVCSSHCLRGAPQ